MSRAIKFLLFLSIYFFFVFCSFVKSEQCTFAKCNNEGVCVLGNGTESCNCVESRFNGRNCEIMKDYCKDVPCQNGGSCISYIGGYYCICNPPNGGQNCTDDMNLFKHLIFLHKPIVKINSKETFLIVVESIGETECTINLSTKKHAMRIFSFPELGPWKFKTTSNMYQIAQHYNFISELQFIPDRNGFYFPIVAQITELGDVIMTLSLSNSISGDVYYVFNFHLKTYRSTNDCFPEIQSMKCDSPAFPRKIVVNNFNYFNAIVAKSCGIYAKLSYQWKIRDFFDKKTLKSFKNTNSNSLKIKPYELIFENDGGFFHLLYCIRIKVSEYNRDRSGIAISRCYIEVVMAPPVAAIEGGMKRNINVGKSFILDGSKSRDLSLPYNVHQKLLYTWSCSSIEINPYCQQDMAVGSILTIPENTLSKEISYQFNLTVVSTLTKQFHSISQEVTVKDKDPLDVTIRCITNCMERPIDSNEITHFEAICLSCINEVRIAYNWSLRFKGNLIQKLVGNEKHLLLPPYYFKEPEVITLELLVVSDMKIGVFVSEYRVNSPPEGGKCDIQPNEGYAFETIFTVKCEHFMDEDEPLKYTLYHNGNLIISSADNEFMLRLSTTRHITTSIVVLISDSYSMATEVMLPQITLSLPNEIITKHDLLALVGGSMNVSLRELIEMNHVSSICAMVYTIADSISMVNDDVAQNEVILAVFNELHRFQITNFDSALQMVQIMKSFILTCKIRSTVVKAVGPLFQSLTTALKRIDKYEDIRDINRGKIEVIIELLLEVIDRIFESNTIRNVTEIQENIAPVDMYDEFYDEYGDFDTNFIEVMLNLRKAMIPAIDLLTQMLAFMATRVQIYEPPLIVSHKSFTISVDVYNGTSNFLHFGNNESQIRLGSIFLKSKAVLYFGPEFSINVLHVEKDLFRYGLQIESVNTDTIIVSFSKKTNIIRHVSFNIEKRSQLNRFLYSSDIPKPLDTNGTGKLDFSFKVKRIFSTVVYGKLLANNDMPVHKMFVTSGSLLLLKLEFPIRPTIPIIINLIQSRRPLHHEMFEQGTIIKTNTYRTKFQPKVKNETKYDEVYLALLKQNDTVTEIKYSIKAHLVLCMLWNVIESSWDAKGCITDPKSNWSWIICSCDPQSQLITNGHLKAVIAKLELPRTISQVPEYHFIVPIFIALMLVIFVLGFWWARRQYRQDISHLTATYLSSNIAVHKYVYLITIETGIQKLAGTTSNITVVLEGSKSGTMPLLLTSKNIHHFQRGAEDRFLFLVKDYLGSLDKLIIWSDVSGHKPSWYCEWIQVHDLQRNEKWHFPINSWFSMVLGTKETYKEVSPQEMDLLKSFFASQWRRNIIVNAIVFHHPRDNVTVFKHLVIFFACFVLSSIICFLYFGPTSIDTIEIEKTLYNRIQVPLQDIAFTLVIAICLYILALLLKYIFRKVKQS